MSGQGSEKNEEELSSQFSKVSLEQKGALSKLILQCEELLKKEDYQSLYPLVKDLLSLDPKDERVISICRRLLSSQEKTESDSNPKSIISTLSDQTAAPEARKEAANKLVKLSSQPTSVFNNQIAEFGGALILIETAFKCLHADEELAILMFSSLCHLALNKECLPHILQKLPLQLKTEKNLELQPTKSLSELLRNILSQIQVVPNKTDSVLFGLYLTLIAESCINNGILPSKQCLIHVLSIITSEERVAQFIRHPAFTEGILSMSYSETEEIRGLSLLFLSTVGEFKESKISLERILREKHSTLQSQTRPVQDYRFLKTIFQTSPDLGQLLISEEGWLLEAIDLAPLESTDTQLELVQVLGLACGTTEGRKLVSDAGLSFLRDCGKSKDSQIKAHSVLARSKLSIESKSTIANQKSFQELIPPLMNIVSDASLDGSVKMTAVESLAYFSLHPSVRVLLGKDTLFWKAIVELGNSEATHPAALYGISAILSNVLAYRKLLSADEQQIQKLKKLAKEAADDINSDPNMADDAVVQRNLLIASVPGVVALLIRLAKSKKSNVVSNVSRALLSLATDRANHGTLLKFGAAKVLLSLVTADSKDDIAVATQALAKLTIHTNPSIALPGQLKLEAIRPLLKLCSNGSLLQQFESLLALTNLASVDMELRLRIIELKGLSTIEMLLLSDNKLVQRSATELLCNMTMTRPVFEYYSGPKASNKLHLLVALSDSEDPKTSLAAGGALATLSQASEIGITLAELPLSKRVLPLLIAPEASRDFQHRGVEIYKNIVQGNLKATKTQQESILALFSNDVITRLTLLDNATSGFHPPIQQSLRLLFEGLRSIS
ncbi:SWI5-dependent HO expression protein 4 [Entomophthora muscae]|uniref:SWI5-dependent HO expression protein 4 n=1 Tax=Entomophthora muscae TaxID=34485 RepID=A0ACC2SA54_9FUNG|nr:SWI5-dependent HO expression protein 4 [Entomophthora muscae]